MAMNQQTFKKLQRQMKSLDYMSGSGLFLRDKRSVNDNRYLIIGYGGTGCDALEEIKKILRDELPEDQYKERIRILAIDTDADARYVTEESVDENGVKVAVKKERFTNNEWLWLDSVPAKTAIKNNIYDGMETWMNPKLPDLIKADGQYLAGTGASATRQIGRLLLSAGETPVNFIAKIQTVASELAYNNADPLRVFIVTGIAGGTGSGTVIDASYLIRHAVNTLPADVGKRTTYCGFIMLPPTGKGKGGTVEANGNRNGAAALKEIDHFMSIGKRNEVYDHRFGTTHVISKNNIFDACYLLDGTQGGVLNEFPRKKAMEVVKNCILDMVTSGDADVMPIDSFMSNNPAAAIGMVSRSSQKVAPRDANFIYCAIGHGEFMIPINLMKTYVAKHVFDRMYYKVFLKFKNVSDDDVLQFLDEVECPGDGVFDGASNLSKVEIRKLVDKAVSNHFRINPRNAAKKGGPYYLINLLAAVMKELKERSNKVSSMALGVARDQRCAEYRMIFDFVQDYNVRYFEVYVTVFEELRKSLERNCNILFDADLRETYDNSSYTVTRIDFTKMDAANGAVKTYLDKLISTARIGELSDLLIQDILGNRDEWAELVVPAGKNAQPRFSAPQRIRQFWEQRISEIVDATMEDYLIKFYSQDPEAKWEEDGNGNPTPDADKYLTIAAAALVKEMWGKAGAAIPLVQLQTGILGSHEFNGMRNFLIPKGAPHLLEYVKNQLKAAPDALTQSIQVAPSTASDRITSYAQFTGIPPYMFKWAASAEKNYEVAIGAADIGLHMSETTGGALWRDFPNLVNEDIYPYIGENYTCPRESKLNQRSRDLLAEATSLGLTEVRAIEGHNEVGFYTIKYLPMSDMIDGWFLKAVDCEKDGTPAKEKAEAALKDEVERRAKDIFDKRDWTKVPLVTKPGMADALKGLVDLEKYPLDFVNTVLTPAPGVSKPAGWEEKLAAALLRTTPENTYRLRGSIMVLERLFELVSEAQAVSYRRDRFVHYLVAGLLELDEESDVWYYRNVMNSQCVLLELPYGNRAMKTAEHYFLFQEFNNNAEALIEELDPMYNDMMDGDNALEKRQKAKAMMDKVAPIDQAITKLVTFDKADPYRRSLLAADYKAQAAKLGYDMQKIFDFHMDIKNDLMLFIP